jgi:uncharacterized protein involved in exopolysaccharide biosynthesis
MSEQMERNQARDDSGEVRIVDVYRFVVQHRWLILAAMLTVATIAAVYAFTQPRIYRATVSFVPARQENFPQGLAAVASQFSGLASLAGIDTAGDSAKNEALEVLTSRAFTVAFIEEHNLRPVLFPKRWDSVKAQWKTDQSEPPTLNDAYQLFDSKVRTVREDKRTGVISLSINWRDRNLAAEWANTLIARLNDLQRQSAIDDATQSLKYLDEELGQAKVIGLRESIYRLIQAQINSRMVANVRKEYAFKVIDPAAPPDQKAAVAPRRRMIVLVGLIAGLVLGVAIGLAMEIARTLRASAQAV